MAETIQVSACSDADLARSCNKLAAILAALDQFTAGCDTLLANRRLDEFASTRRSLETSLETREIIEDVLKGLQSLQHARK
jgi:hypothetical protein